MNASPLTGKRRHAGDVAALVVLFLGLVIATWRRWPDPLVDVWRNNYIAWRVSEGALWAVDVADWYGPLPPLVLSAAFAVFGPGLDVIIVINCLITIGCIALIHAVLLEVGDRVSAAVGGAVFVLVFTVGNYTPLGNYNFITPYATQAVWGFFGVLLTLLGTLRFASERDGALLAGIGVGLALVNKAETTLAALAILTCGAVFARRVPWKALGGAATVVVPIWLLLALEGGPRYATWATGHSMFFVLDPRIREIIDTAPVLRIDIGTNKPWPNLLEHLRSGGLALLALATFAAGARVTGRARALWVGLTLPLVVALAFYVDWIHAGRALLLPVFGAAVFWLVPALRGEQRAQAGALFAIAALSMLARMALNVRLYHYGFTMAVLATMVVVHLFVSVVPRGAPSVRVLAALLFLAAAARMGWNSVMTDRMKSLTVGSGRDESVAWSFAHMRHGTQVNEMLDALNRFAPAAETLVVFPDGAAVNYFARRPSPIPEFEFNPVSLAFAGGPALVRAHLEEAPPDVIFLSAYQLTEHGARFFGDTPESGATILDFIAARYTLVSSGGPAPGSPTGHSWDLFVKK